MNNHYLLFIIACMVMMQFIQTNGNKAKQAGLPINKTLMNGAVNAGLSETTSLIITQIGGRRRLGTHRTITLERSGAKSFVGQCSTNCCEMLQDAGPDCCFCCFVPVTVVACYTTLKEHFSSKK